jgi:transposase InsO family protein
MYTVKEKGEKVMGRAEEKLVEKRFDILELAKTLRNVSEACRRRGVSRSQIYEYKKRFQEKGMEGLKDLPPIHKWRPQTTKEEDVKKILELSLKNPMWGCVRLSNEIKIEGASVSSPTIQNILIKEGLGSRYERLLKLERVAINKEIELSEDQIRDIERANPCFKERRIESGKPGELLSQDTFFVGTMKGVGKVYLQAVVDTYGSYAFGYLRTGKIPEHAVAILESKVLPKYKKWNIGIENILTDNGSEFCGREYHIYELYLNLNDIKHKKTAVRRAQSNGFAERFNRTILDEFFRPAFRSKFYSNIELLQKDLDVWLKYYNNERSHQGYRNMGKRPIDTINVFLNL